MVISNDSVLIRRNPDHWADASIAPYDFSLPVAGDQDLADAVCINIFYVILYELYEH